MPPTAQQRYIVSKHQAGGAFAPQVNLSNAAVSLR